MRWIQQLRAASMLLLALAACDVGAPESSDAHIQRAALTELFLVRERAGEVVIWSDSTATGPVFSAMVLTSADSVATPAGLPLRTTTLADLAAMFRESPDGWRDFYSRFPRTPGLVEVSPVEYTSDHERAALVIARSCGEHCRMAWRVQLITSGTTWTVERVTILDPTRPVPGS